MEVNRTLPVYLRRQRARGNMDVSILLLVLRNVWIAVGTLEWCRFYARGCERALPVYHPPSLPSKYIWEGSLSLERQTLINLRHRMEFSCECYDRSLSPSHVLLFVYFRNSLPSKKSDGVVKYYDFVIIIEIQWAFSWASTKPPLLFGIQNGTYPWDLWASTQSKSIHTKGLNQQT